MSTSDARAFVMPGAFAPLTTTQILKALYVSNLPLNANLKRLSDVFACVGDVEKVILTIDAVNPNKQVAVVVFDDQHAYATGLLLNHLLVGDATVDVWPYNDLINVAPTALKPVTNFPMPNNRPAEQVVESFIDNRSFARDVDTDRLLSRARKIDQQPTMTERVAMAFQFCTGKIRPIESEIPVEITGALNAVKSTATNLSTKVRESEALKNASQTMSKGWDYLKQQFTDVPSENSTKQAPRDGGYHQY